MRMRAAATPSPPLLPGPHSTPTQGTLLLSFSSARALARFWSRSCSRRASSRSGPPTRTAMGPSAPPMTPSSSSSRPTRLQTAPATPRAARSIRSRDGMPYSSMACRSSSFIWAAVATIIAPPLLSSLWAAAPTGVPAPPPGRPPPWRGRGPVPGPAPTVPSSPPPPAGGGQTPSYC